MKTITLTTDFGLQDWFVGTMKGVILSIQPRAQLVDVTHMVAPGDVQAAAFALAASFGYFPKGTVHLVVVDPGVGSSRAAIAVRTSSYFFVGPDNGVLSLALERDGAREVHSLEDARFYSGRVSRTFHGRDLFAPVAAHLTKGLALSRLGPKLDQWHRLIVPQPVEDGRRVLGSIQYIDHFGNAITNLSEELHALCDTNTMGRLGACVRVRGRKAAFPLCQYYQQVPNGQPLAIVGSSGYLEVAINGASAARSFRLKVGDPVWLELGREPKC